MKIDVNRKALVNFMINDGYVECYHDACDKEY